MNYFGLRTEIYSGENSLNKLNEINLKKIFIVTDPFMVKSGMIDKITENLKKDIEYKIFSQIVPDPPLEVIMKGVNELNEFESEGIIALGGGSAIDAAKAISCFFNRINEKKNNIKNKTLYFIAIPTTSGTGSEVTSFSVITDKEKNIKYPLISDELLPNMAILDPELVKSVPDFITADTGMDVLTHAIEAYVSTEANDFTDALSEKAIKIVFEYLKRAYKNGNDTQARIKMHNASCIAGIAFNNVSLGLNHGMAHILGGKFHIPHGRANAILLPYVIEYNAELGNYLDKKTSTTAKRYANIAKILGLSCSNTKIGVKNLIFEINKLKRELNIPNSIKEVGIKENDFDQALDFLSQKAIEDRCTETNPRKPKVEEIKTLFKKVYNG
ncbi:iron-containing alcohol dehydrogenase [Oceanotoga sp. DSM 15011]|uniref:1-propanol dehydrogenase PduQ n=1 Tax=Oceanotoga sp. DSM 15011 TaxID=2984951 RepID=UPI0021F47915|nr:1-propanol dehydrogenase PduQ [Oceanotoga sp. DSM 15011]UYP00839.1 iron-containing alcohol dehydrogenase [Oceanotoga sp. DSM 15011]